MDVNIIVALIMGGFSCMGIIYSSSKSHSNQEVKQEATIERIRAENYAAIELIKQEFHSSCDLIMQKIKELEKKQDKHNGVIERLAIVEQKLKSGADRLNKLEDK